MRMPTLSPARNALSRPHVGDQRRLSVGAQAQLHAVAEEGALLDRAAAQPACGTPTSMSSGRTSSAPWSCHAGRAGEAGAAYAQHAFARCASGARCSRFTRPRNSATKGCCGDAVERSSPRPICTMRPAAHHRQPVGDRHRLLLVVRDVDGRDVQPPQQLGQLVAQRLLELGVEGGQRLVQQQHARAHGHARAPVPRAGAGRRKARRGASSPGRPAASGRPARRPGAAPRRARCRGCAGHSRCWLPPSSAETARSSGTPCRRRAAPPAAPVTSWLAEEDAAARIGRLQPGDQAQQRGLAAARGAEQREHLARLDVQRGRLQAARAVGDRSWRTPWRVEPGCAHVPWRFCTWWARHCRPHRTGRMTMKKTSV